jgi:putative selenium metabolism hydrolase
MIHGAALARDEAWTDEVTLWVVGSVQEEDCDGLALEHVLTSVLPRPDVVVLGEATDGGLYRGNRGRIEALIRTRGSSCHASAPGRGYNPVYDLAPMCSEIEKLNAKLGWDEFLGAGSIALTKISCDTPSLNSVPSSATLYIDRRLTIGESADDAMDELRSLPSVLALGAEVELLSCETTSFTGMTLTMPKAYRTWVVPEESIAVQAGLDAGEQALGRRPHTGAWVFSTNGVASMGKLGIPTIGYGPGNEIHAHTVADQCPVRDLSDAMAFYAGFPGVYAQHVTAARARHAEV